MRRSAICRLSSVVAFAVALQIGAVPHGQAQSKEENGSPSVSHRPIIYGQLLGTFR
jgi:hypothetical protein